MSDLVRALLEEARISQRSSVPIEDKTLVARAAGRIVALEKALEVERVALDCLKAEWAPPWNATAENYLPSFYDAYKWRKKVTLDE